MWELEWGPFPAAHRRNPRPEVPFYCQHFMSAFSFLQTDRLNTFNGMGYIPISAMVHYCDVFKVPDRKTFTRILHAMDIAYVGKATALHARKENQ